MRIVQRTLVDLMMTMVNFVRLLSVELNCQTLEQLHMTVTPLAMSIMIANWRLSQICYSNKKKVFAFKNNRNILQILTGKGVDWWSDETKGAKFKYNDLHLWANEHGHITLQKTKRYDEHTLIYSSSFHDILDETIIYYKNDYRVPLAKF